MTCDWCSLPPNRCTCFTPEQMEQSTRRSPVLRMLVAPQTEDHAHYYRVIGAAFMRWQMAQQLDARNDSPPVTDGARG